VASVPKILAAMPLDGFAEAAEALGAALQALKEARATGQKGTIRTARRAARAALEAAQKVDAIQTDTPRETPLLALPVLSAHSRGQYSWSS
jgi:hypothetical protein